MSGYVVLTAVAILAVRGFAETTELLSAVYCTLIAMSVASVFVVGNRIADRSNRRAGLSILLMLGVLAMPFALAALGLGAPAAALTMAVICVVALWFALSHSKMLSNGIPLVALAAAFTGYFFITVNSLGYAWVMAPESALAGLLHRDILYHGAIASMLRESGTASTGLDGLQPTHYHVLSHAWIGTLSRVLEIDSVKAFVFAKQLVFIPLLLFALAVLTRKILGRRDGAAIQLAVIVVPMFILQLVGLVDFISYLESETHAAGLALLLVGVALLVELADERGMPALGSPLFAGALLGLATTAVKVSAGLIFLAGLGYLILRRSTMPRWYYAATFFYLAALAWLLRAHILPQAHVTVSTFSPLHFVFTFQAIAFANLVPIVVAALVCIRGWNRGIARLRHEMLLIILITSTVPALLLKIDGGSAYYFINLGTWVAIAIIAAAIIEFTLERHVVWLTVISAVCLASTMVIDLVWRDSVGRLSAARSDLSRVASSHSAAGEPAELVASLKRGPLGRLADTIQLHRHSGNLSVVYLEPGLWDQLPNSCPMQPLFIPAFVGLPVLAGLEPQALKCDLGQHYSMPDYGKQAAPITGLSDGDVCLRARRKGAQWVLRVDALDVARRIDCSGA